MDDMDLVRRQEEIDKEMDDMDLNILLSSIEYLRGSIDNNPDNPHVDILQNSLNMYNRALDRRNG